jgi:hypothetical protein
MALRKIPILIFLVALIFSCTSELPTSNGDNPELTDEAKLAAIWLSDEPFYPVDLAQTLQTKLAELREEYGDAYPNVNVQFRYPAVPKELLFGFTQQAMQEVVSGDYHEWDELNEQYGVSEVIIRNVELGLAKLVFEDQVNPYFLGDLYETLPGVIYSEPNGLIGDWSNIYPWLVEGQLAFLVREAWGDCPAGCIYSHFWYFKSTSSGIRFIGEFVTGEPKPGWWPEIEPALCKYIYGEAANCGIYGG